MLSAAYQFLLMIHPPTFRRRFAAEMLGIFDQAAASEGEFALFTDALVSLGRQWILRSGSWKFAAAIFGASLQITAGGLLWLMFSSRPRPSDARVPDHAALEQMTWLILAAAGALIPIVAAAALWTRSFTRRRLRVLNLH